MLTTVTMAERLRVTIGRLARKLRQQSLGGLTPSQTSVLATLGRHGPMMMSDLAQHEGISKPSATGIVGRLVDKGFVERKGDPSDGRSAIVEVTASAGRLLEQRRRARTAFLTTQLEGLAQEDRRVLERALELLEGMTEDR